MWGEVTFCFYTHPPEDSKISKNYRRDAAVLANVPQYYSGFNECQLAVGLVYKVIHAFE